MQMTFTLRNISDAMHAKRLLVAAGIPISLSKLTTPTENGCGYAVTLPESQYYGAIRVLRKNGIFYHFYQA